MIKDLKMKQREEGKKNSKEERKRQRRERGTK